MPLGSARRGRGERLAAVVGPAEGGEASLSELCIAFCLRVQHALLPLSRGAADIYIFFLRATPTAAGPSSYRQSVFSDRILGRLFSGLGSFFDDFWLQFLACIWADLGADWGIHWEPVNVH